jgi:DNA-binding transcriptional regulator LsrR (DeoR family)
LAKGAGVVRATKGARLGPAELLQAAAVARRFYLDGRSKIEIADEFGLSRFKVARILDDARASGLVRIEITTPAEIDIERSEALRAAFDLHYAVVISTPAEPESSLRAHLGRVAADLLSELVADDDVLGVGWGRTINAISSALTDLARCTVVQLSGALTGMTVDESSVELVRRIGAVSGGLVYPIYAPLIVPDAATAAGLRQQPQVAEAIRHHDEITKAIVAIGSWDPPNSQVRDALSDPERARLEHDGVLAEVCGTFIDHDGQELATPLAQRVISITGEQLRSISEVVAVAGGPEKAAAIRAVICGRYATSLVTDQSVADILLAQDAGKIPAGA